MFLFALLLHSLMQPWRIEVIFFLHYFEVDASLSPMCQILVSFFEMDNIVYGYLL